MRKFFALFAKISINIFFECSKLSLIVNILLLKFLVIGVFVIICYLQELLSIPLDKLIFIIIILNQISHFFKKIAGMTKIIIFYFLSNKIY